MRTMPVQTAADVTKMYSQMLSCAIRNDFRRERLKQYNDKTAKNKTLCTVESVHFKKVRRWFQRTKRKSLTSHRQDDKIHSESTIPVVSLLDNIFKTDISDSQSAQVTRKECNTASSTGLEVQSMLQGIQATKAITSTETSSSNDALFHSVHPNNANVDTLFTSGADKVTIKTKRKTITDETIKPRSTLTLEPTLIIKEQRNRQITAHQSTTFLQSSEKAPLSVKRNRSSGGTDFKRGNQGNGLFKLHLSFDIHVPTKRLSQKHR